MTTGRISHAISVAARQSAPATFIKRLLGRSAILEPYLRTGRKSGWPEAARQLLSPSRRATLLDGALLRYLRKEINANVEVELLLTEVRNEILQGYSDLLSNSFVQEFACAVVQQCINNEYVWFSSEKEQKIVDNLLVRMPSQPPDSDAWKRLCVVAMYRPLLQLLPTIELSERMSSSEETPQPLRTLVREQEDAHQEEVALRASIECFSTITDQTSKAVRAMYEAHPYPRWITLIRPQHGSRHQTLKRLLGAAASPFQNRPLDVLVPGCGTGRKAIQIAFGFGHQARIFATDLSRSSLAYAARMARKYEVKNIQFLQMDILDLPKLDRQFDVVECTGVLHHLRDPVSGGRAILSNVKPGGLVHISLYSELARREIVRLRREYEDRILTIDADYIRAYRRKLMLSEPETIDALPTRGDFFDLSRCKDLLFHPVERRFTIPELSNYLRALDLEFLAFETPRVVKGRHRAVLPTGPERSKLDSWWRFEQRFPDAFGNLYEVWCRKVA